MSLRRTTLSPLIRFVAVLLLTVFVAAQTVCFIHCSLGAGRGHANVGARPSCHDPAPVKSHENGHNTPARAPTPTCSTFKTMLAEGYTPTLVPPQFHTLYPFPSMELVLETTEVQPQALSSRRAWPPNWVFTPEVCLGPALRSLAPPFVG